MAKPIEFLPDALAEAESAAAWYAAQNPRASAAFEAELDAALDRIAEAPTRWPSYLHGTRRVLLSRFPYLLVYREESSTVLIVAVAHAKRRAGYWRRRDRRPKR